MRYILIPFAALGAVSLAAMVWGLAQSAMIDIADQGVLLMFPTQASECRGGGGCAAYSRREFAQAQVQAFNAGRQSCGSGGKDI